MKAADWAWLVLATAIVAYEAASPPGELLSEGIDRYRKHHPILTDAAIIYIAAHLLRRIPPRADPLHQLAVRLGR